MNVVIEGTHLPGRTCHPNAEGYGYTNVHVGLCVRGKTPHIDVPGRPWGVVGVVAGDAPTVRWDFDVELRGADFGGPYVRGARGDRHIFLAWGEMAPHGPFELFRGSKLRLDAIDPGVLHAADRPGRRLVGRMRLTDAKGNPSATDVRWSAEPVQS
jgi:hypothetical protein